MKQRTALWKHNCSRDNQTDDASMTHLLRGVRDFREHPFLLCDLRICPKLIPLDQRVDDRQQLSHGGHQG